MISPSCLNQALDRALKFNPNMQLVARIYQLLQDPNTDLEDASKLIETDGALTSQIIRLCNSTYYAPTSRIYDLYEALQQVGLKETLNLVGTIISKQLFMRDLKSYGLSSSDYWVHGYYCALYMEGMSKHIGVDHSFAYLIGLLHGIGKVVINEALLDEEVEVLWDPSLPSFQWEKIMTGENHASLGAIVLEKWGMPETVCTVIKKQSDSEQETLGLLLAFARSLAENNNWDLEDDFWKLPEEHEFYQNSNVDKDIMLELNNEVLQRVKELYQFVSKI